MAIEFRGSARSIPFNPLRAPDQSDSMRQQLNDQMQWRREDQQSIIQNRRDIAQSMREDNALAQQAQTQNLEALSGLSESIGKMVVDINEQRRQNLELEGYTQQMINGLPPEVMREFDLQEAQLLQGDQAAINTAAAAEGAGASTDVVKMLRTSGGAKGYGEARALAEMGAAAFPSFYQDAASQISVNIDGKEITLSNASNTAERAAVETLIQRTYLKRFLGVNPALLEKYLFPGMRNFMTQEAASFARSQKENLKVTRIQEAKEELLSAINAGYGGERFIEILNRRAGDFGGLGPARITLIDTIRDLVKKKVITGDQVRSLLDYSFTANDGDVTTIGKKFQIDFAGIEDDIRQAQRSELQDALQDEQDRKSRFILDFNELVRQRESQGRPLTEAELLPLVNKYRSDVGPEVPNEILDYKTREDRDDDTARQNVLATFQDKGFITEQDIKNVSPQLYSELIKLVQKDKNLSQPSKAFLAQAREQAAALTNQFYQSEKGSRDKSPAWVDFNRRALADYERKYAQYIRSEGDPAVAHEKALASIKANAAPNVGTYKIEPVLSSSTELSRKIKRIRQITSTNSDLITQQAMPGIESEIESLNRWRQTGKGEIPHLFQAIASNYRDLQAWDIARAQYRLHTGQELVAPRAVQAMDTTDPAIRRLLNTNYTTPARTNRAALMSTGWKPFLDLIASQESKGYGEYDAMNTGGAAGGTVAYGSANSRDVFGRGLSQMTIADVMNLQQRDKLHAAGRYQIIEGTLNYLMTNPQLKKIHGLTPDQPFSADNQDRLAVALARRRMLNNEGMAGLRNEWIGLRKVSDRVLQNAMSRLSSSPFNQPENLTAGLVYRIGNLGYGSTGPHLDVKPVVRGGTTTSASLPAIKAKELDNYVLVGNKRLPLSQGSVTTDDDRAHRNRKSFGHDFAAPDGTPVYLINGARVVHSFSGDQGTDHLIVELPDGRRYQFLHGKRA